MAIALETTVRRCDDVVHHEIDEGSVLLHLGSGEYHGLNELGGLVWDLIAEEKTVAAVIDGVRRRTDAPPEVADDVLRFLEELRGRDLVDVTSD